MGDLKVEVYPNSPEMIRLKDGMHITLYIHLNIRSCGFKGTLLTVCANEEGTTFLKKMHKRLGGFFQASDCGDEYEGLDFDPDSNSLWLIRHQVAKGNLSKRALESISKDVDAPVNYDCWIFCHKVKSI